MTVLVTSIRQQLIETIRDTFAAIVATDTSAVGYVPSDDDWPFQFSSVVIGRLGDVDNRKEYTMGVVVGPERTTTQMPYEDNTLEIGLEFRKTVNRTDTDKQLAGEAVLTMIKRVIAANNTWGGLAMITTKTNNEIDTDNWGDRTVAGIQFMNVRYRCSLLDPRRVGPPDA